MNIQGKSLTDESLKTLNKGTACLSLCVCVCECVCARVCVRKCPGSEGTLPSQVLTLTELILDSW